jgi:cell wall-associated NlpC family hydrolase
MSEPSYFDNARAANALRQEALSWVGTPFREYYQDEIEAARAQFPDIPIEVKGQGGGIDCIGLVQEIFSRIEATEAFVFKREEADYESHGTGEKILDWMRGKLDDPQSKRLAEILIEVKIPEAVTDPLAETPRDFFKPGDILVMQHGSLFHLPVIYDNDLHFVNALPRLGVIEGTIQDSSFNKHLVAVFRLKPSSFAKATEDKPILRSSEGAE